MKFSNTLILLLTFFTLTATTQKTDDIKLPPARQEGGMPLFDALKNRKSSRNFSAEQLSLQQISDMLWTAFGISREERGLRTAPSARNWQDIDIYVALESGWFLYEAVEHKLIRKGNNDIRQQTGVQDFVATAPVNLVYVSDFSRMSDELDEDTKSFYAANHAGYISQNIYLFCASESLATVVRGAIDREIIRNALNLKDNQHVIFAQTIGFPL